MKRILPKILFTTLCIFLLSINRVYPEQGRLKKLGSVTSVSECNNSSETGECIEFDYENKTLHINHLHTEYNCCFKSIKADIEIIANEILIQSYENYGKFGDRYGPCD